MRVLGIDPGLREFGWAIIEAKTGSPKRKTSHRKVLKFNRNSLRSRYNVISCGLITTSEKKKLIERLSDIATAVQRIVKKFKPDICAIESVFVWKDPSAALKLGMVLGVCIEILRRMNTQTEILSPLSIKSSVSGDRYADKEKVRNAVLKKISLTELISNDGKITSRGFKCTFEVFNSSNSGKIKPHAKKSIEDEKNRALSREERKRKNETHIPHHITDAIAVALSLLQKSGDAL